MLTRSRAASRRRSRPEAGARLADPAQVRTLRAHLLRIQEESATSPERQRVSLCRVPGLLSSAARLSRRMQHGSVGGFVDHVVLEQEFFFRLFNRFATQA